MDFKLVSDYAPMGDQPEAIGQLVSSIEHGSKHNTLLGVTGSGKTFTVANVIARLNRPTLVLSHNKTLAAQLYGEFRNFFPENAVEYFVSYYDYYQPEAYLPSTDTYIEKDLQINAEIEKMRLGTVATLLSGRRDVIVVSSVSCLYGAGNPADFHATAINIKVGQVVSYKHFLYKLVEALYTRTERELEPAVDRIDIACVTYGRILGDAFESPVGVLLEKSQGQGVAFVFHIPSRFVFRIPVRTQAIVRDIVDFRIGDQMVERIVLLGISVQHDHIFVDPVRVDVIERRQLVLLSEPEAEHIA